MPSDFAEAHHLALFFAVEEVVVVLHGDEAGPAVEVGEIEGLGELPGVHGRGADVAGFAGFHDIVEGFEGFFDGGFVVPAMDLVEVDVVGLEAAEALVDFEEDRFAGEAAAVGVVAHEAVDLGGEDDVFAFGVGLEEAADEFFAGAVGVDVGGVEEIDAEIEGLLEEGLAVVFVEGPGVAAGSSGRWGDAVGHAAKTDAGDFKAGVAEIDVVHGFLLAPGGVPPPLPACKLFIFSYLATVIARKIFIINGLHPKYCFQRS